jgi:hypothetical protein
LTAAISATSSIMRGRCRTQRKTNRNESISLEAVPRSFEDRDIPPARFRGKCPTSANFPHGRTAEPPRVSRIRQARCRPLDRGANSRGTGASCCLRPVRPLRAEVTRDEIIQRPCAGETNDEAMLKSNESRMMGGMPVQYCFRCGARAAMTL